MPRKRLRGPRRHPPAWFMPAVMAGLGVAAVLLSVAMFGIAQ